MTDILNQINWEYVAGFAVVIALIVYKVKVLPYLQSKGINNKYLKMIEQCLLLGNMAFRTSKVKQIFSIAIEIVCALEEMNNLTSTQKHVQATESLANKLLNMMNITLPKETMNTIIRIAVAFIGEK